MHSKYSPRRPSEALARIDFDVLCEAAPDGILLVDAHGLIVAVNRQTERLFGYEREELQGESVERLVPASLRELHAREREGYVADPKTRPMGIGLELSALRKDGTQFPVEISLSGATTPDGTVVIATVRDVSERRRLRAFGAQALRAMEAERKRIALELHDETIQTLAALLIRLKVAQRNPNAVSSDEFLGELRREIAEAADGVRRMAAALRPPELDALGVGPAIESHARMVTETTGLPIRVEVGGAGRGLPSSTQLALYRIVQEALSNTLRHAEASAATVRLWEDGDHVVVEVEDDGVGFNAGAVMSGDRRGLGLFGMLERASYAGGRAEVDSEPGSGTRITARLPLTELATRD